MYKDFRFINAGENEFYRWGKKAQAIDYIPFFIKTQKSVL